MTIKAIGIYLSLCRPLLIKNDFPELFFDFPETQKASILLCCNDNVISLGETGLVEPEKFPDKAFDLIPSDRVSCLLTYCNP